MNKTTITIAAVVIGIVGLMLWGRAAARPAPSAPSIASGAPSALTAPETLYDFGTIRMANGEVSKVFKVTNPTDKDIFIPSVTTSCMCTRVYLESGSAKKGPFGMPGMGYVPPANELIRAGETRDIEVVYDPNAHGPAGVGSIDRFAYLTDEGGGTLALEIKALVTP